MIIENVRIIDPAVNMDQIGSVHIVGGKLHTVGPRPQGGDDVLDGTGLVLAPGLIDMHVHLRDPGFAYKEDLQTGARAAAAGGFTAVACMPNTNPVIDNAAGVRYILENANIVRILPIAAVTMGQAGERLTDMAALRAAGAVAFSDDGVPVESAERMRAACLSARRENALLISHCEDNSLAQNYAVNEGAVSRRLGITGRPAVAEELMVARELLLARDTGARVHIAHVSTKGAVAMLRQAKRAGIPVTAETCPQYFTLTETAVLEKGALARVNPPLRTPADLAAVLEGLVDGTLDAIVTDHAPHSMEEKCRPLETAPSGMIGLETSLALSLTGLYHTGRLSLPRIIRLMSTNPADILGIPGGRLTPGAPADLTLFDPDAAWTVDPEAFYSKARNTPFGGMTLKGRVMYTIVGGEIVFRRSHFTGPHGRAEAERLEDSICPSTDCKTRFGS